MNRLERAKQFLPFDAVKGLQEALREKEKEHEERIELAEESLEKLEEEFNKIEIGRKVKIKFYKDGKYVEIMGNVSKINNIKKKLEVDFESKINYSDIAKIEVI